MGVKCFMVEPGARAYPMLRRYSNAPEGTRPCPGPMGYHNADGPRVGILEARVVENHWRWDKFSTPRNDPRWPAKCDHCDYRFTESDEFQDFVETMWVDMAGKEYSLRHPVPGMMWDAFWCHDSPTNCGPDGKSIHVICPDGSQWCIDSRASNCTMPDDNVHKCWIRHGEPPNLTVDKAGHTCSAGAGSIAVPGYHGFLQNGEFT